jgi:hypothetical protein
MDCHGRVGISGSVDDDRVGGVGCLLNPFNQLPLKIGLSEIDIHANISALSLTLPGDIIEGLCAVYVGLSCAKQVEVGAVENECFHAG